MNQKVSEITSVLTIPFTDSKNKKVYFAIKRLFDIVVGILGTLIIVPISLIIKIAYLFQGDFYPIFFVQERIGINGKIIKILKFRSMIPNAEEKLEELMAIDPKIKEEYLTNKKLENDPRITKIGALIRKASIDEFPQFINVLLGDMSLVGPRPYLLREKKDMGVYYNDVIKCKPGITGLWQVSGRSDVSFKYRLKLDRIYLKQRGIKIDIKIMFKTFKTVLGKNGAK